MITDHGDFVSLRVPSPWGLPQFQFGDQVNYQGTPGTITGLHWVSQTSPVFLRLEAEPGWWVEITYTDDSRYARTMISEYLHESVIQQSNPGRTGVELSSGGGSTPNRPCGVAGS
jgi:hypothetical protein